MRLCCDQSRDGVPATSVQIATRGADRAADDPNLHYLDGRDLYGERDHAELPLPDDLRPDAATHRRIGERFAELAFTKGPFAESSTPTPT